MHVNENLIMNIIHPEIVLDFIIKRRHKILFFFKLINAKIKFQFPLFFSDLTLIFFVTNSLIKAFFNLGVPNRL